MELGQHISQRYNQELENIRSKVMAMGGLVEVQADKAIRALLDRDAEMGEVVASSDYEINKMEIEIDEDCTRVIARRQPTAGDLRLVIAVIKVITDLERIGDEAEQVGLYAAKLAKKKPVTGMHSELSHLSDLVLKMLHDVLDAFARLDADQAMQIVGMKKKVNKEFTALSRLLMTHMMEDQRNIKSVLHVNWCSRSLGRIGDHSRNIAEYVIYLVKGKDVRHTSLKKIRAEHFSDNDFES